MTTSDPSGPDPRVLDLDVIEELRELGGPDDPGLLGELIELFLEDAPARLAEMEAALDAQDLDGMQRAAHTLKSSSANLGAVTLSALCSELETAARENDAATFRARHVDCGPAFDAAEAALKALRD